MKREQCFKSSISMFFTRRSILTTFILAFCLTQLSGCSSVDTYSPGYDAAPKHHVDTSKICDAEPRHERFHPYGTKDYVLKGRKYRVLKNHKGYVKRGYASWYGTKFHGKQTSTQEPFSMYEMTAASKELPLPSYAKVTNLQNGRTVVVRVNDRGPFHKNRIIDLSYAAAKKLGFAEQGVAKVKVEAIDAKKWAKNKKPSKPVRLASNEKTAINSLPQREASNDSQIFLQVGAFSQLDNAKRLSEQVNKLIAKPTQINHRDSLYRVHIGPLASVTQGSELKEFLEKNGFEKVSVIEG